MKFLSNGRADHKEVLIQIHSVHRKFLKVSKSYDYSGYNHKNSPMTKICDVRLQSYIRKVANFTKVYCENENSDQIGK